MTISVLVVDNDETARNIVVKFIEYGLPNVIIHITAAFESALELCKAFPIDIVVTTTSWPSEASDLMLKQLRGIKNDPLKIIIMTSSSPREELRELESIPNTSLIPKPLNMEEFSTLLIKRIAQIGQERQERT